MLLTKRLKIRLNLIALRWRKSLEISIRNRKMNSLIKFQKPNQIKKGKN